MQNKEQINELETRVKELEILVHELKMKISSDVIRTKALIIENVQGNEVVHIYEEE